MSATNEAEFDQLAENYDATMGPGIVWSGEKKEYFARQRVAWLARRLRERGERPKAVMDFGCGTGTAIPFLFDVLGAESVVAVDNSAKSLDIARRAYGSERVRLALLEDFRPDGRIDLVYCNGVFHHIPPAERAGAVDYVCRSLRPGGYFGLWENNIWNPVARLLMALGPIDRNAIPLAPPATRRLVSAGGLEVLGTDFLFIFPKWLGWLRGQEYRLARWPLGLQYEVLCRKAGGV